VGRQSLRSQVREESSGEVLGRVLNFEGGFSLARRISMALQVWSKEGREQREKLEILDHLPLSTYISV
jgi:hypothetical protein